MFWESHKIHAVRQPWTCNIHPLKSNILMSKKSPRSAIPSAICTSICTCSGSDLHLGLQLDGADRGAICTWIAPQFALGWCKPRCNLHLDLHHGKCKLHLNLHHSKCNYTCHVHYANCTCHLHFEILICTRISERERLEEI